MPQPSAGRRSGGLTETAQKMPLAHRRLVGEPAYRDRLRQMMARPLHYLLEPTAAFAERERNELLLPTVTVRGNDQPPRDPVRHRCPEIAPYQVEPSIDAGRAA